MEASSNPNMDQRSVVAVVTGDVAMDWNIAHTRREVAAVPRWTDELAWASCQRGGAALLADLVTEVVKRVQKSHPIQVDLRSVDAPRDTQGAGDRRFARSYVRWSPTASSKTGEPERWRVEEFLGQDKPRRGKEDLQQRLVGGDPPEADIVVLDDADFGFRGDRKLWPKAITESNGREPWIVLKMSRLVVQGDLWEHLIRNYSHRLIAIASMNDMRRAAVRISRGISWEQTAEDLVDEVTHNPRVNGLSRAAHAIISFDMAGALLLTAEKDPPAKATLLFDPTHMEGEWEVGKKGAMIGYTATLTAAILRELLLNQNPDLARGVRTAVAAMRHLFDAGYHYDPSGPDLAFPQARVAEWICDGKGEKLGEATVPPPTRGPAAKNRQGVAQQAREAETAWTILGSTTGSLEKLAKEIVRGGLEHVLEGIPVTRLEPLEKREPVIPLETVDRREIEALRSVRALIAEHCDRRDARPLSIAVFGPPGAGKSFAVTQLAKSIRQNLEPITFNLSQLSGPEELIGCFHQVRDLALKGKIPLVFWDEFDTSLDGVGLGWLRCFLAPMQDGEFLEGRVSRPIGKSIFVFAGGTAERASKFAENLDEETRRARKVPDFQSRLRGFLEVLGPDRPPGEQEGDPCSDPYYVIRRAIVLRAQLKRFAPSLFDRDELRIDSGVLNGFLRVTRYRHGVRSIEALIATSQLSGHRSFERSCLPPRSQLGLHVDATEFLAHVNQYEPDGKLLDRVAEAVHESFCAQLKALGYTYAEKTDDAATTHSSLKPFAELSENEQEQNRDVARDLPRKLAILRHAMMIPDRGQVSPIIFSKEELKQLAKLEHQRWMDLKLREGWRYAAATDKLRKLHNLLVPWEELPESEKEKDREQVRRIPEFLDKLGLAIVRLV